MGSSPDVSIKILYHKCFPAGNHGSFFGWYNAANIRREAA